MEMVHKLDAEEKQLTSSSITNFVKTQTVKLDEKSSNSNKSSSTRPVSVINLKQPFSKKSALSSKVKSKRTKN